MIIQGDVFFSWMITRNVYYLVIWRRIWFPGLVVFYIYYIMKGYIDSSKLYGNGLLRSPGLKLRFLLVPSSGRGRPVSPEVSNRTPLSRNVPSRSTFHSGQTRQRNHTPGYGRATPLQTQDTSAIAHARTTSFFSKISSKFSKRWVSAIYF